MKIRNPYLIMLSLLMLLSGVVFTACKKDEEKDKQFETGYTGQLKVTWESSYPYWSVTSTMKVEISTEKIVVIEPNTLVYSGEKIVSDDSKLTRSGWWDMSPTGKVVENVDQWGTYIYVDPHIFVMEDVTRVYAKDNYGNWVLVGTAPYMGDSQGELAFRFDLATTDDFGHSIGVQESTGSITWTLTLMPAVIPIP